MTWQPANPSRGLGIFLRKVQRRQGWNQSQLAEVLGISPIQVSKMQRGVAGETRARTWDRVADGLLLDVRRLKSLCRRLESLDRRAEEMISTLFETSQ